MTVATPEARALRERITELVGGEMMDRLVYRGEVGAFHSKLAEVLGSARAGALEAALSKGDVRMSARLAAEPNPAMSNYFGELLEMSAADMLAHQAGGRRYSALRAALAERISAMVGQDLVEGALPRTHGGSAHRVGGAARRSGPRHAARCNAPWRPHGRREGAQRAARAGCAPAGQAPPASRTPRAGKRGARAVRRGTRSPGRREERRTAPLNEGGAHAPAPPPAAAKPVGARGVALSDALSRGADTGTVHELALDTIAETASFKELRRQVSENGFGEGAAPKVTQALQAARARLLSDVQSEIAAALKAKHPGIDVEFANMGTPGFNSDMDFTINVRPGRASVNEAIAASVEGVRAAYDVLNGGRENVGDGFDGARAKVGARRLPPDRVLDSNFYTELHEDAIAPRSAAERLGIVEDQSVVSMAETRMNMPADEWPAYKKRQLGVLRAPGRRVPRPGTRHQRPRTDAPRAPVRGGGPPVR